MRVFSQRLTDFTKKRVHRLSRATLQASLADICYGLRSYHIMRIRNQNMSQHNQLTIKIVMFVWVRMYVLVHWSTEHDLRGVSGD